MDPVVLTGHRHVGRSAVVRCGGRGRVGARATLPGATRAAAHQADDAMFAKLGRAVCCRGGRNH